MNRFAGRRLSRSMVELLLRSRWRALLAAVIGASLAAAYAHFIGCRTGTCPITSNTWVATIYGAAMGALIAWPG